MFLAVLDFEVFVCKFLAIDRLTPRPVEFSEITALCHEARNHPVEDGVLKVEHFA